jgi:hypothetical protein
MFGTHFYHAQIRRMVAAFGTIFNNISVHKTNNVGDVITTFKVPLAYGPIQKFLARIEDQANLRDPKLAIKLPRMSFEITSLAYDSSIKINKLNQIKAPTSDPGIVKSVYGPVPYRMGIQLNIIAKNQDDALQILEQILPYFQPDYTVTINDVPELGIKSDTPFVLQSVVMNDDYEGDFESRRAIIYTLEFETRVRFYTGVSDRSVIETATVDMNVDIIDPTNDYGFIEEVTAESSPNVRTGIDTTDDNKIT